MLNTPEFQALRREYLQGVLQRCVHLGVEAGRLRASLPVDLRALRQDVHKFRGSGGFFGFPELSAASATAEDQLVMVIDGEAERNDQALADLITRVVGVAQTAAAELGLGA